MSPSDLYTPPAVADRIVVLIPGKPKKIASSAIEVVEQKQPEMGEVVAIGGNGYSDEGVPRFANLKMEIGDLVAYRRYGSSPFYIGGQQTIFVGFEDLLGVIEIAADRKEKNANS